jgi:hypothetical protein
MTLPRLVLLAAALDSYEESERNGITTQPYPAWGGIFVILDD